MVLIQGGYFAECFGWGITCTWTIFIGHFYNK